MRPFASVNGVRLMPYPVSLDDQLPAVNNIYIKRVDKKMFGYDKDDL